MPESRLLGHNANLPDDFGLTESNCNGVRVLEPEKFLTYFSPI